MIQRIQTVYLMLASIALGIQTFSPLLKSSQNDSTGIFQDGTVFMRENMIAWILLIITALTALITIFLYNNRKIQKLIIIISIVLILLDNLLSGISFLTPTQQIMNKNHAIISPGIGALMPIVGILALLLAYRGINKDNKIVKSMDRLR